MAIQRPFIQDTITRIYKNSAGDAIAIQEIPVFDNRSVDGYRTATVDPNIVLKLVEGASQSRVIDIVQQLGNFDSFTESGGNVIEVVYPAVGGLTLTVDLSSLPLVGESI